MFSHRSAKCLSMAARMACRVAPVLASVGFRRPRDFGRCRLLPGLIVCSDSTTRAIQMCNRYTHSKAVRHSKRAMAETL